VHRLTALAVKRYVEDPSAVAPLHDGGGLYLRKRDASALWYLRLTEPATGAQQWQRMFPEDPFGGYPHRSLIDARVEAKRLCDVRSQGTDPRAQRLQLIADRRRANLEKAAAEQRQVTVRALFERWRAVDLRPQIGADGKRIGRKDGGEYVFAQFERRVFPKIGHLAAEQIKRGDLLELLDAVKSEGKLRTANMLLTDLKQMFRFALARDLVLRNPLDTVSKRDVGGQSVERDRILTREEIRQLSSSIEASGLHDRFAIGIWVILATSVRIGELVGAVWSDPSQDQAALKAVADAHGVKLGFVNLERRTWYLPETKNQRDHTIHLSAFAIAQFRNLAQLSAVDAAGNLTRGELEVSTELHQRSHSMSRCGGATNLVTSLVTSRSMLRPLTNRPMSAARRRSDGSVDARNAPSMAAQALRASLRLATARSPALRSGRGFRSLPCSAARLRHRSG